MSSYVQEIVSSSEEEIDLVTDQQEKHPASSASSSFSKLRIRSLDSTDTPETETDHQPPEEDQYISRREAAKRFEQMGVSESVRNAISLVKGATSRSTSSPSDSERSGFKAKKESKEMIKTNEMQAMKASSQRIENQTMRSGDMLQSSSSMSQGSAASMITDSIAAEKSSFSTKKQQTLSNMREGMMASKEAAHRVDNSTFKSGDTLRSSSATTQSASAKMVTPDMEAEKKSFEQKKEETIISNNGSGRYEKNTSSSSSQRFFTSRTSSASKTFSSISASSSSNAMKSSMSGSLTNLLVQSFDGTPLALPSPGDEFNNFLPIVSGKTSDGVRIDESDHKALEAECLKAEKKLAQLVEKLKRKDRQEILALTPELKDTLKKCWFMLGVEFSNRVCDKFRTSGGLDVILENCKNSEDEEMQRRSASVLQYCLSSANVEYVLKSSESHKIVELATSIVDTSAPNIRSGIGIIANLFTSSEETCKELVRRGALDTVIANCRILDNETQRNCAYAFANLALFGGSDCQHMMVRAKVPDWLFMLGFSMDDHVKYNACLTIAILTSNKEIEASVIKSSSPMIIEQFISHHAPSEFSQIPHSKFYGQSKDWLKKFTPILDSFREEAKSIAAFHFAVSAFVKRRQGDCSIFKEVNCINLLNKVAASPNAAASRFAAQALKLIGAEVPHKLSQQVPLWTVDDVKEWVKQIGFESYINSFAQSRVDGDLLLQLTEEMLKDDIGIKNGILRKRFLRELGNLKRITDYSSCDPTNVTEVLESLGQPFLQVSDSYLRSFCLILRFQTVCLPYVELGCRSKHIGVPGR